MRSPVFVRNFEAVLRELVRRGHAVHVAFEGEKAGQSGEQRALIAGLAEEYPGITIGDAPAPSMLRRIYSARLRGTADYLRYLAPEYDGAVALRTRARAYAIPGIGALEPLLRRRPRTRRRAAGAAQALARLRPPRPIETLVRGADVLLVSPLTHFGSPQPDYVRAARALGVPSALALFSWDNLTNKGLIHERPDRVIVWNELQADEAVEHHGIPREHVDVTGAAAYDHWFRWLPSREREPFLTGLGLDPGRPCLLYLCSSEFIAGAEPAWIGRWIDALRATGGALADAGVIVRPHPLNREVWDSEPLAGRAGVRVFPARGEDPTGEAARRSYFDSIFHSAVVVGINTTALVESAIVGRRSYTVRVPEFAATQDGTLHFHQLREDNGGPLRVADSMEEHLAQLESGLSGADRESLKTFVRRFVRPLGLESDVAPAMADRIEALARR